MAAAKQDKRVAVRDTITEQVGKMSDLITRMGVTPQEFARVTFNALFLNPSIVDCDKRSLERCIVVACEVGLLPNGREAAIVPFKGQATLIAMVEGKIKLAKQATPGLALRVRAVYRSDRFEYEEGLEPKLVHIPQVGASQTDDDLIAVYAVAQTPGATVPEFEVMFRSTIDRYRARSAAGQKGSGPWSTDYVEMAKKTVIGQLLKRMPKSVQSSEVLMEGEPAPEQPQLPQAVIEVPPETKPKPAAKPKPKPVEAAPETAAAADDTADTDSAPADDDGAPVADGDIPWTGQA